MAAALSAKERCKSGERERERLFANRQETRWRNGGKGREDRPA
jgi:hypothetical protein